MTAPGSTLVAAAIAAAATACAHVEAGASAADRARAAPAWSDEWGIQFALHCAGAGNDARLCACVADEVKKRWTPAEFRSLGPDGLRDQVRLCQDRLHEGGGR